jgi:long-chain acyl-CoA synthetase
VNRVDPLLDWAFSEPDKTAVSFEGEAVTFAALVDRIRAQAAYLAAQVSRGDLVALYIDNTPDFIVAEYGCFWLGAQITPLSRTMTPSEIREICQRLGVRAIVTDDPDLAGQDVPVLPVVNEAPGPTPPLAVMSLDDGCFVLMTSGSTGRPKGIGLSYRNIVANYDRTYRWVGLGKDDVMLICLPLHNTFGLNQGINLMATTGARMILHRSFSPTKATEALRDEGVTFFPTVPTMISRLRNRNDSPITDRAVKCGIGAAPTGSRAVEDLWSILPGAIASLGYGLTEATALVTRNRVGTSDQLGQADLQSVGIPVPGAEVALLDVDEHGVGEIGIKGDWVFDRYVGSDDPLPIKDGWLRTGDLATRAENGHFYIRDRVRDLIIRGGQNIYPGEIERALGSHPAVLEAALIGRPDEDLGERPVAYVSIRQNMSVEPDQLRAHLAERLAPYKVPDEVVLVDELPRGATGKISKPILREADAHR